MAIDPFKAVQDMAAKQTLPTVGAGLSVTPTPAPTPGPTVTPGTSMTSTPSSIIPPAPSAATPAGGGGGGSWGGTPTASPAPAPAPTPTPAPVQQPAEAPSGGRLLGPTEYLDIVRQNKVGPSTFDQYFYKVGNDIFLKPGATPTPSVSSTAPKEPNIDVSQAGGAVPPVPPASSSVANLAVNTGTTKLAEIDTKLSDLAAQRKAAQDESNKLYQQGLDAAAKGISDVLGFDSEAYLKKLQDAEGLADKEKQLSEIKGQINDINTNFNQEILDAGNLPIPLGYIRGRQAQLREQAAAAISGYAAKADIISGEITRAQQRVSDYFNAKVSDNKNELLRYQTMVDLMDKGIIRMDKSEKENFDTQLGILQGQSDRLEKDKSAILQLMTNYPDAFAAANVTFDMPLDEIAQRVGAARGVIKATDEERQVLSSLISNYPDAGITLADTLAEASAKLEGRSALYQKKFGSASTSGGAAETALIGDPTVDAYVSAIKNGTYTISDVPAKYKSAVTVSLFGNQTGSSVSGPEVQDTIGQVEKLKSIVTTAKEGGQSDGSIIASLKSNGVPDNAAKLIVDAVNASSNTSVSAKEYGAALRAAGPLAAPKATYENIKPAASSIGSFLGGLIGG